jgi:SAM-dependent methyltransferase
VSDRTTDPRYLDYQYGDAEKLRIRLDTHRRYSERSNDAVVGQIAAHLAPAPGLCLADVGCGPGSYFRWFAGQGLQVIAVDRSVGMLREARQEAARHALAAAAIQADAQALPLRDASCDRALAAHMLYHVPDQLGALRELRRVLRPGGRVVLVTNGPSSLRLLAAHQRAARAAGYAPAGFGAARFTLADLPLVHRVFPTAERVVLPNAFVFPTAAPALRYYASGLVDAIESRPVDGSHRAPLLAAVEAELGAIIASEGRFRDPKEVGCFVADV